MNIFKKSLWKFVWLSGSNILNCHNTTGVELLTRLKLSLSQFVSITLNIAFVIHLAQSVDLVKILKRKFIFSFTVFIIRMKDQLSWILQETLVGAFWEKTMCKLLILFLMAIIIPRVLPLLLFWMSWWMYVIVKKPVNWFTLQTNWLLSICW